MIQDKLDPDEHNDDETDNDDSPSSLSTRPVRANKHRIVNVCLLCLLPYTLR
jgi:hypothetical protein